MKVGLFRGPTLEFREFARILPLEHTLIQVPGLKCLYL